MSVPELARLERVEPRSVWKHEAGDFTPWLTDQRNLSLLAEVIGKSLDLESREVYVGPFRADIVCLDSDGERILIENQLAVTDHTHLGQILTYAAGLDAKTVVWLATSFTDEHRAALDWLNRVTQEGISFFGVQIEAWRIANSPVAPSFKLVCQPNDWVKTSERSELTDEQVRQLDYWNGLKRYLAEHDNSLRLRRPRARNWAGLVDDSDVYRIMAAYGDHVHLILGLHGSLGRTYFHLLRQERNAIEEEIRATLDWKDGSKYIKDSHVILESSFPSPLVSDPETWQQQYEWLLGGIRALRRSFAQRIQSLSEEFSTDAPREVSDRIDSQ